MTKILDIEILAEFLLQVLFKGEFVKKDVVRVELHCHSNVSDGTLSPTDLANECLRSNVQFAALTDHDTTAGLEKFESFCRNSGMGFISGIEITSKINDTDIHILGYGFDWKTDAFSSLLAPVNEGTLTAETVIRRIHNAGGIAVFAHPFATDLNEEKVSGLILKLTEVGLDGIEVFHHSATEERQKFLKKIAEKNDLVITGGSDFHGENDLEEMKIGMDFERKDWEKFRNAIFAAQSQAKALRRSDTAIAMGIIQSGKKNLNKLMTWMVIPAVTVVVLFLVALFGFFLPGYEKELLQRKKDTIKELTHTVWSMLEEAQQEIDAGALVEETKMHVADQIRHLRYGPEEKDYFWIQDLTPKMIVHPYRPDLDGKDIGDFTDKRGVKIFSVFADIVKKNGEGYADYVWQWKDNPDRQEAKESYIKLFKPWGWVIGTGIYTHDAMYELSQIRNRLIYTVSVIAILLTMMLLIMIRGGLMFEKQRKVAEKRLEDSNERYRSLVQAAAEGLLVVKNGLCTYANPVMLELIGCGEKELELITLSELFPGMEIDLNQASKRPDVELRRMDGSRIRCSLRITGQSCNDSFICIVRKKEDAPPFIGETSGNILQRILQLPSVIAQDTAKEIAVAKNEDEVISLCLQTPQLVTTMLVSGADSTAIVKAVTEITDAATARFIELKQTVIGKEPVPFTFLALGSQGRHEQTLFTDQDNALIFHDDGEDDPEVEKYFSDLSKSVCGNLARSGYRPCGGKIMAENPKWCQPLSQWKKYFSKWIDNTEPQDIIELNTFFDMRAVAGNTDLLAELKNHIFFTVEDAPQFFLFMANEALKFKVPLQIFGSMVSWGQLKENDGRLDLKAAMMPVVNYARIFALRHSIREVSTSTRLLKLYELGHLSRIQYQDIMTVFKTLLKLRLNHQESTVEKGRDPDNLIDPLLLGSMDDAVLKECFKEIELFQEHIKRAFIGSAEKIV